jgi:polyferredoxin
MSQQEGTKRRAGSFSLAYWPRRVVQAATFVLFLGVIVFADPLVSRGWPAEIFPLLSPLAALTTMIGAAQIITHYWPALVVLILTILLGRFFCGWICPLGTTIDVTDWMLGKRRKRSEQLYDGRRFKYYLLVFLLLGAIFGVQMAGWFDPLSIAPRTYAIVIHPYVVGTLNMLFGLLHSFPFIGPVCDGLHGVLKTVLFAVQRPVHQGHVVFLLIFLGIVLMGIYYRRYWCRNLCPLGALFALVSDWSVFKRGVSDACIKCLKCHRECRMGAIDDTGLGTVEGECIECMDCQRICPVNAITFAKRQPQEERAPVDLRKRALMASCLASAVAVPALRLNFPKHMAQGRLTLIRPPGSLTEEEFLLRCVRCGECMRVCRTQGLHPTTFEAGLEGIWTPQLVPRIGYCDYKCTLCGHVCPSHAIKPLTFEEKQKISIGKAKFDKNRCIPWVGYDRIEELKRNWEDLNCGTCEEVCPVPTKAIRYQHFKIGPGKELRVPYVKEELCVGCGYCVKVCPVRGQGAIAVDGARDRAVVAESVRESSVNDFFPESVGEWRRTKDPTAYVGRQRLFDYIDGGAEPYLTFGFKQVVNAPYGSAAKPDATMSADIWELGSPADAYGVFTKDHPGGPSVPVGDAAATGENQLCIWRDRYYIRVEQRGGKPEPDALRKIGQAIANRIEAPRASTPPVMALLPEKGQVPGSAKFFRDKLLLDNIYLTDNLIEENIFTLADDVQAAAANYQQAGAEVPFVLMLIQYPSADRPVAAQAGLLKLRKTWDETIEKSGDLTVSKDANGLSSTIAAKGRYLLGVFRCKDRKAAEALTQEVLAKLK